MADSLAWVLEIQMAERQVAVAIKCFLYGMVGLALPWEGRLSWPANYRMQ